MNNERLTAQDLFIGVLGYLYYRNYQTLTSVQKRAEHVRIALFLTFAMITLLGGFAILAMTYVIDIQLWGWLWLVWTVLGAVYTCTAPQRLAQRIVARRRSLTHP